MKRKNARAWRIVRGGVAVLCGVLAVVIVCLSLQRVAQAITGTVDVAQAVPAPGQAYVFRFDPLVKSFQTFTVPTVGAGPLSVDVVSNAANLDVWFTEPRANRIGRLTYTDTADHVFREYAVGMGSGPMNLVADGSGEYIWFTARHGNWIGRLAAATGVVVTFPVPTADSRPAGVDLAPDGSVWFTEMAADKIGHLVVTTTSDYNVTEYPVAGTGTDVGLYDVAVWSNDYVWVAETKTGVVRRLKVADGRFIWTSGLGADDYPYDMVVDSGRNYLWLTERDDDQISLVELTSLNIINSFDIAPTPNFHPTGLTMLGSDQFWFAGQGGGQVGQMVYTSPTDYDFQFFDLPLSGLWTMDVVFDPSDKLWMVAYSPQRIFLPLAVRK